MSADRLPFILQDCLRRVPPPPLGAVPFPLQRAALERSLRLAFRQPAADGQLAFLEGRRLRITVTDLDLCWDITGTATGPRVEPAASAADVELRADGRSFGLLATRRVDPDTLFFRRQLSVTGDTELGLACKNLMDSLELEAWHPLARAALVAVGRLLELLPSESAGGRRAGSRP